MKCCILNPIIIMARALFNLLSIVSYRNDCQTVIVPDKFRIWRSTSPVFRIYPYSRTFLRNGERISLNIINSSRLLCRKKQIMIS